MMPLTRRTFVRSLAATAAACGLARADDNTNTKLPLSAPLTHSDWLLKPGAPPWGEPGVRHMLDTCKECGWSHIYWRVFDAGVATYHSKLLRPGNKPEPDDFFAPQTDADRQLRDKISPVPVSRSQEILSKLSAMNYADFDSFAYAIKYGHEIGLKIHAWATINEDDHGWGWPSEFSKAHPEFHWVRRDGKPYHSQLSFAFPEVRAYKLGLIQELLSYDLDGIFLDWIRTGDVRDNPQTDPDGVAASGYESPNIEAFKSKFNVDPHNVPNNDDRWIRLRAEPQTIFMRSVRELVAKQKTNIPIAIMVGHPWHYRGLQDPIDGNLRGLLLDVTTWADEGLMDSAIAAGYYRPGGDATKAYQSLASETRNKVDLWHYAWVPQSSEEFAREFTAANSLGAKRVLFWEADDIDDRSNSAELKQAMSAVAPQIELVHRRTTNSQ